MDSLKTALITGGMGGIGREMAANKYNLILVSDEENGEEFVAELDRTYGSRSCYFKVDVSDPEHVEKLIEDVRQRYGRLDVLVNCAGIVMDSTVAKMSYESWKRVLSVNLDGTFLCTKFALPLMKAQHSGRIINISSVSAEIGNFGQANYAASKGAVISFTKTVAREVAKDGVTVNAVAPGFIDTRMTKNIPDQIKEKIISQIPLLRFGRPEEVTSLIVFLASDASSYITGQVINVNGGLYM
jgi:3-oxoacyl-[acyl-carrier protein] reductase